MDVAGCMRKVYVWMTRDNGWMNVKRRMDGRLDGWLTN